MDAMIGIISLMLAFVVYNLLILYKKISKNLPPGPYQLPIIGNLAQLSKLPHQSLAKLAQTYGPIMLLKLGSVTTIVISSSDMAQQVLQKQDLAFSSRFVRDALHASDHSKYSVVWLPVCPRWRKLRRLAASNIFSSSKLDANQHLRHTKVNELIGYVKKCGENGEAVDIGRAVFKISLNLLSNTIFSKDIADPYQDSAKELRELVWDIMVEAVRPNVVDFFPVLAKMDPQGVRRKMSSHLNNLMKILYGLIDERGSSIENNDVLDELIKISQENPDEIDKIHIVHLITDLFAAGTDTTSSTVEWGMAEVLKSSETTKKAKAELNQVVGKGKMVEEADVSRLPYLRCIVSETLRLHPPVPFLLPRQTTEEVELNGYKIPKKSQVLVNAWAIGRDPSTWTNPLSFQPERFSDSEVDVRGKDFELIPFGAGRRICPGLSLAMRMVPVMLGSLINCFDWELQGGIALHELDMDEKFGLTVQKLHPLSVLATTVAGD